MLLEHHGALRGRFRINSPSYDHAYTLTEGLGIGDACTRKDGSKRKDVFFHQTFDSGWAICACVGPGSVNKSFLSFYTPLIPLVCTCSSRENSTEEREKKSLTSSGPLRKTFLPIQGYRIGNKFQDLLERSVAMCERVRTYRNL